MLVCWATIIHSEFRSPVSPNSVSGAPPISPQPLLPISTTADPSNSDETRV